MPARWAMREADFEVLLRLAERLGGEQRTALGRALASASGEPEAVRLLEGAFAAAPRCPHCAAARLQRWGHAGGAPRPPPPPRRPPPHPPPRPPPPPAPAAAAARRAP